jgi:HSP20 family molecular chaperone IbpA
MDDSVEISAEQSQEEDERKKNFVYNQRSYSSFFVEFQCLRRFFLQK